MYGIEAHIEQRVVPVTDQNAKLQKRTRVVGAIALGKLGALSVARGLVMLRRSTSDLLVTESASGC